MGKITLENWIRNKIQEQEEMQDYSIATDTLRCWIDEYNEVNSHSPDPVPETLEEIYK